MARYNAQALGSTQLPSQALDLPREIHGQTGATWDARHLTHFLNRSHYSNWRGEDKNISRVSAADQQLPSPQHCTPSSKDYFFKTPTLEQYKNTSLIGFTNVLPLVANVPVTPNSQEPLHEFFKTTAGFKQQYDLSDEAGRNSNGSFYRESLSPEKFKFMASAVKFKSTDPITMHNQCRPSEEVSNFAKYRMKRLIEKRHPHGMVGIDHNYNNHSEYYSSSVDSRRLREEPNKHESFLFDREWKSKTRVAPPESIRKHPVITLRKFSNDNMHGYNIVTNRQQ